MSVESDKSAVMAYIKASLPILSNEELEAAADAVLEEVKKRKNGKD